MLENTKIIIYPGVTFNQEYRIDTDGNIWSPYSGWHKVSLQKIKKGYLRAGLMTSQGRKFFMVHRLVMNTFNPIQNSENMQVNHKDGNKQNNNIKNLEWVTNMENMQHAIKNNLAKKARGEKAGCVKLTEKEVLEICDLLQSGTDSLAQIGEKYGVTKYCIFDIKRKRSWAWLTKDYKFN